MADENGGAFPVPEGAVPEHLRRWRAGDPSLAPLYEGFPPGDPPRRGGAKARLSPDLVRAIARRNGDGEAPAARANLEALKNRETAVLVAGQQPGVLLGPILTLYKMLTLQKLAAAGGEKAIPLFWVASHDADREEAEGAVVADGNGEPRRLRAPFAGAPARTRLGALRIDREGWLAFLGEAAELLPATPRRDGLLERLRAVVPEQRDGTDLFAATARVFLPDLPLLFLDGRDAEVLPEGRRILAAAAREPRAVHAALAEGARLASAAGVPVLLPVEESRPPFFLVEEEIRVPVRFDGRRYLPEGKEPVEPAVLAERIEAGEARATPAAALRPVLQDGVLPVGAYVAGLSELVYHASLGPLYAALGVRRPPLLPRAGFALLPARIADGLEKIGVDPAEILAGREEPPDHPELAREAARFRKRIDEETAAFLGEADRLAPGAVPPEDPARSRVPREANRAADRVLRMADRAGENRRRLFHKARAALLPGGKPQEAVLSPLGPFARFGPGLADRLAAAIRPGDGAPRLLVPDGETGP